MKIEEWPSRAKWGQARQNGAKWCQMVSNRVKRGQTGPKGPTEPNEAKWGHMIFCMHVNFYEIEKSCLATQALRQKLAEPWGFC